MAMELTKHGMPGKPNYCMACRGVPLSLEDGSPLPAIDLNTDINWGENAYICWECAEIIGDLVGRVKRADYDELKQSHETTLEDFHGLEDAYNELKEKVAKMVNGAKAKRDLKSAA